MKKNQLSIILENNLFSECYELQKKTIYKFYDLSRKLTKGSFEFKNNIYQYEDINKNFFSVLFLSIIKSLISKDKYMPLYAFINQSMRATVTACDNILDDEYKEIFPFDIKEEGKKIKSVFTLMISDRVLSNYVMEQYKDEELLNQVNALSFKALVIPALQECSEELKPLPKLSSKKIIEKVHKRKTGDLFASTLAIPFYLENIPKDKQLLATDAVTYFGLACQIIDDIKDLYNDIKNGGHNYLFALESENINSNEKYIKDLILGQDAPCNAWEIFPESCIKAEKKSLDFFNISFEKMMQLNLNLTNVQRNSIVELMYDLLKVRRLN